MTGRARLCYVVPTVGSSPYLRQCLAALARGEKATILLAATSNADLGDLDTQTRTVAVDEGRGFAGACNQALASMDSDYVALVNDDALVDPDWAAELISVLEDDPELAAAQGTNLQLSDPSRVDGCGIGWNRHWQAIQLHRGQPPASAGPANEIFGASGTAVVMRRRALEKAALVPGEFFEPRLGTYYEDVELACRLRASGFRAVHLPSVQVRHAGATSSSTQPAWRWRQIYGNRLLVLARLLGSALPAHLPRILVRDLEDLARAALTLRWGFGAGILGGWGRALHHMRAFAHRGAPLVAMSDLHRFQISDTDKRANE